MNVAWFAVLFSLVDVTQALEPFENLTWPPTGDFTAFRQKFSGVCKKYSCAERWIRGDQSAANVSELTNDRCPGYGWPGLITHSLQLFSAGRLDWKFVHALLAYQAHSYCNEQCGLSGPFSFYSPFLEYQHQVARARSEGLFCFKPLKHDYCVWWSYMIRFRIYFAYFAVPSTLLTNYINLSTLRQMMTSTPGPALYLHLAEVLTDALYNLVINLHECLMFFSSFDRWMTTCRYQLNLFSFFQSFGVVTRYLSFMNQAFLAGVVADRLYALSKPITYNKGNLQLRGKLLVLKIFLGSTLYYAPFFIWRAYHPLIKFWGTKSTWWKYYYNPIDLFLVNFYQFFIIVLVVCQAVCSIIFERKFRKYVRGQRQDQQQLRRRERDKRLLLAGTVGLNLVTTAINVVFQILKSTAFFDLVGISKYDFWQRNIMFMLDPVFNFINGNGAVVFHVLLVKSYRRAFTRTKLGRLLCAERVPTATTRGGTSGDPNANKSKNNSSAKRKISPN